MLRLLAALFLLLSALFWFKREDFLPQKVSFSVAGTRVVLADLGLEGKRLRVGVLAVKLPPSPPVKKEKSPDAGQVRRFLSLLGRVLEKFPLEVSIKNLYLAGEDFSLNFYGLRLSAGSWEAAYGELFKGLKEVLTFEGVKLFGNAYGYELGGRLEAGPVGGRAWLRVIPPEGRLLFLSELKVRGERLRLEGRGRLGETLRALFELRGGQIRGRAELVWKGRLSIKGRLLAGRANATVSFFGLPGGPRAEVLVRTPLCGKNGALLTLLWEGGKELLLAGLEEENLLYAVGRLSPRGGTVILTDAGSGSGEFTLAGPKAELTLKGLSVGNLCGLRVSNLSGSGAAKGAEALLELAADAIGYGPLSLGRQRVSLSGNRLFGEFEVRLGGSVKGLVLVRRNLLWGFLFGNATLRGRKLFFALPKVEAYRGGNETLLDASVGVLRLDGLWLEDLRLAGRAAAGRLQLLFGGGWNGTAKLEGRRYEVAVEGRLFGKGRVFPLRLEAEGDPLAGAGRLGLSEVSLSYSYSTENGTRILSSLLTWDGLKLKTSARIKGRFASLSGVLSFNFPSAGVYGNAPFRGEYRNGSLSLAALPFCAYQLDRTLACFKKLEFSAADGTYRLEALGLPDYPLAVSLRALYGGGELELAARSSVSTEFLNSFLTKVQTLVKEPERVELSLNYRGPLSAVRENLRWSFSQKFLLYSAYFYKPLELYASLFLEEGVLQGLFGFADGLTGEALGTAELLYPLRKRPRLRFEFEGLPLRLTAGESLSSYLTAGLRGSLEPEGDLLVLNATASVGGFVSVSSYSLPKKGKKKKTPSGGPRVFPSVELFSSEPIYVKLPDGYLVLTVAGRLEGEKRRISVFVNYGTLTLFNREYFVSGAEVRLEDGRVYLELPLVYYAPERTIYLKIYGYLPWQNLKLDVRSTPPAPKEELLVYLVSGGGEGGLLGEGLAQMPLTQLILKTASAGMTGLLSRLSSELVGGLRVAFVPVFDPAEGMLVGVEVEKFLGDYARLGYRWLPSKNPKATYLWGSLRFIYDSFLRAVRYSDGSTAASVRLSREWGLPF
ncbi:MAG: hypothetical protein GXO08_00650 [Aquificae bacterium]|nr:hypothetical protein [Aquificota bacterium]